MNPNHYEHIGGPEPAADSGDELCRILQRVAYKTPKLTVAEAHAKIMELFERWKRD